MTSETTDTRATLEHTADIVAAYVSNNRVSAGSLPEVIAAVSQALTELAAPRPAVVEASPLVPAVSIKKSVSDDYITCLEDGKSFKSLKRHLMTHYNLTPEAYRAKWKLPADYPMVAPNYAAARSRLAKTMGLGRKAAAPMPEPMPEPAPEAAPAAKAPKTRAPRKPKEAADDQTAAS